MVKTTITLTTSIFLSTGKPVYSLVVLGQEKFHVNGDSSLPIIANVDSEEINIFQHNVAGLSYATIEQQEEAGEVEKTSWREKMPDVLSIIKEKDETTS